MRHRLTFKLPLLVLAGVAVVVAAAVGAAVLTGRESLREQQIAQAERSLGTYRSGVREYLGQARALLSVAADHIAPSHELSNGEGDDPDAVMNSVLRATRAFEYLMLLDRGGRARAAGPAGVPARLAGVSFARRSWLRHAGAAGFAVSDLEVAPATGRPTLIIAVPVRNADGAVDGVLAGGLHLATLSAMGTRSSDPGARDFHGYVTDRRGLIVAHQGNPVFVRDQADFSSVPWVREALEGRRGTTVGFNPVEGREKLSAYAPLPETGGAVVFGQDAAKALEPLGVLTRRAVLAGAGAGLVLAALFALVIVLVLRRLSRLREAAARIGQGELSARLEVTARDEIGLLGEEFNRMADDLVEREERLAARSLQLQEANARLEGANAELDAFAYTVSHDLRAPLRAIDGFSRILVREHESALGPEGVRYLGLVCESAGQMGELVDDLLEFSRLGRKPIERRAVHPEELVAEVMEELGTNENGHRVNLNVGPLPPCLADPTLLRQVLANLLGNAVKYSRESEPAEIEVGSLSEGGRPGMRTYFVRDNGVGFDMRYADKLFGVFQRLHRAEEYEGTGVGLAIVHRIITRHDGEVWADAQPGRGATFYFTLQGE